jgi:hypothetical protein
MTDTGAAGKNVVPGETALQDAELCEFGHVAPPPKSTLPSGTACCKTPAPVANKVIADPFAAGLEALFAV